MVVGDSGALAQGQVVISGSGEHGSNSTRLEMSDDTLGDRQSYLLFVDSWLGALGPAIAATVPWVHDDQRGLIVVRLAVVLRATGKGGKSSYR